MGVRIFKGSAKDGGFWIDKAHVSKREVEVLSLAAMGFENEDIARKLGMSVNTVRNHLYNVTQRLRAKNRTHAVVRAIERGILEVTPQNLAGTAESDFRYCLMCMRTYRSDEIRIKPGKSVIIDHVRMKLPESALCAYRGCKGDLGLTFGWDEVRHQHPEYPEIPKHGVKYAFEWTVERGVPEAVIKKREKKVGRR